MRIPIVLGAAAVLLTHTTSATAAPDWCKGGKDKPSYNMKTLFAETDPEAALASLVGATCYADADIASYAKQIEATRQAWSKKLGFTEADWVEINEWAHWPRWARSNDSYSLTAKDAPMSKYSPLDQFSVLSRDTGQVDVAYVADALGAKLSHVGRLGFVRTCMSRGKQDDAPVMYAMCAADVAALDLAKIYAEISADTTHELSHRMGTRFAAYTTVAKVPAWQAEVKAFREKDPAYDKMFELAEQATKAWGGVDATTLALMADLDDARTSGSRRASQGCMARAEAAWKGVVQALPIKKLANIAAVPGNTYLQQLVPMAIATPTGYLAGLALNQCATMDKKADALARVIGATLVRWPGFRGPRTGTQTTILTAGLELDRRDATITYPTLSREFIDGDTNIGFTVGGVAKVEVAGDKATITFQKRKVKQTRCTKGHHTNRVQRVNSFGQFEYEYQCDNWITETIEVAPSDPLKVTAKYAVGVSPGMTVSITDEVVVVAYPKDSTTPSLVTGVAVK